MPPTNSAPGTPKSLSLATQLKPSPNSKPNPPKPKAGSNKPALISSFVAAASSPSRATSAFSLQPLDFPLPALQSPAATSFPASLPAQAKLLSPATSNKQQSSKS